jgi:hypothetical protein
MAKQRQLIAAVRPLMDALITQAGFWVSEELSPFPGMDPYLENSELWSAVHNRLIVAIAGFAKIIVG